MIAAAAAPMTSVSTMSSARSRRLASRMTSERLSDAEVHAPPARLRLAVHQQPGYGIELVSEVEANGPDRRLITQSGSNRVPEIVHVDIPRSGPDVSGIEEGDAAEVAAKHRAQLDARRQHAVTADRQASAQRAQLVGAPAANAGRAAEEVLLRKRYVRIRV